MWQKQVTSTLASTSESTIHNNNNNKSLVSSPPDRAPSPSRYIPPNLIPIPILLRGLLPKSNCTSRTWRAAADRTLPPHVVQARVCLTWPTWTSTTARLTRWFISRAKSRERKAFAGLGSVHSLCGEAGPWCRWRYRRPRSSRQGSELVFKGDSLLDPFKHPSIIHQTLHSNTHQTSMLAD